MSFSSDVKKEIVNISIRNRHCGIAELSAIIPFCLKAVNGSHILQTENPYIAKRLNLLLNNTFTFNIGMSVTKKVKPGSAYKYKNSYCFFTEDSEDMQKILLPTGSALKAVNPLIVSSTCCKRAYIRGAFLLSGSLINPEKNYHAEFVTGYVEFAESIKTCLEFFELKPKILTRKDNYIVYLKESEQISDLLNIVEAHEALMELENIRILKEMRNDINRKANFDTANFDKTVSASAKQVLDIEYIISVKGMSYLPEPLQEVANLRLHNNQSTLKEIGLMLRPVVSKSGVNHRFRKISEIADTLRGGFI